MESVLSPLSKMLSEYLEVNICKYILELILVTVEYI